MIDPHLTALMPPKRFKYSALYAIIRLFSDQLCASEENPRGGNALHIAQAGPLNVGFKKGRIGHEVTATLTTFSDQ
jgi:hypothetical protein